MWLSERFGAANATLVLFISLADKVTETREEDHDQGEDDAVEKDTSHDIRAVGGGELGNLHWVRDTGKATPHEVKGELPSRK